MKFLILIFIASIQLLSQNIDYYYRYVNSEKLLIELSQFSEINSIKIITTYRGENNCYIFVYNSSAKQYFARNISTPTTNGKYRVRYWYYLPSTNSQGGLYVRSVPDGEYFDSQLNNYNAWIYRDVTTTKNLSTGTSIYLYSGSSAIGDSIIIKDLSITKID